MFFDIGIPGLFPQHLEIPADRFASGNNDEIRLQQRIAGASVTKGDGGMHAQRVEIRVVADTAQYRHDYPERAHTR